MNRLSLRTVAATMAMAAASTFGLSAQYAQGYNTSPQSDTGEKINIRSHAGLFNQLEIGVNIGTMGFGLEVGTPVTEWVRLRAGIDWVPRFNIPMNFDLTSYTDNGDAGAVTGDNFDKVQNMMNELTGFEMDEAVTMNSKPTMTTFRFMADVYPFKGKGWRITAGFFAGGKTVGKSINAMGEMPTLLCVGMYNRTYDYAMETDIFDFKLPFGDGVYLEPEVAQQMKDRFEAYGRIGIHLGDFKDGTPYIMEPDKDGTVSARAIVNAVRPYIGVGYDGAVSKDGRWALGFDLGVQFWGGAPKVVTHEGVDLTQLTHLRGKVNDYISIMKGLPVYPTANFKISYTLGGK